MEIGDELDRGDFINYSPFYNWITAAPRGNMTNMTTYVLFSFFLFLFHSSSSSSKAVDFFPITLYISFSLWPNQ